MKAAGFNAVFCNIGDFTLNEWGTVRNRGIAADVTVGVWARCADQNNNFSEHILNRLILSADTWACPGIVNNESELKGSGNTLTQLIANKIGSRDMAVSMESKPFANVDWTPLAEIPMLPQMFIESGDVSFDAIKQEWHDYGVKCVYFTFGVVGRTPDFYDRKAPYSVYTADDMGGDYAAWSPTSTGFNCTEGVDDVEEPIGEQDGITGYMKWIRSQPDVPVRGPAYDPENISTWPWPDKIERTLRLLKKAHDDG